MRVTAVRWPKLFAIFTLFVIYNQHDNSRCIASDGADLGTIADCSAYAGGGYCGAASEHHAYMMQNCCATCKSLIETSTCSDLTQDVFDGLWGVTATDATQIDQCRDEHQDHALTNVWVYEDQQCAATLQCMCNAYPKCGRLTETEIAVSPFSLALGVKVILTPPCIFFGESLVKCTGWRQNDFNVQALSSHDSISR